MFSKIKEWLGLGYYESQLDLFLAHFRREHPKLSLSQRKEKEKYEKIHKMRDCAVNTTHPKPFWDKF